VVEIKHSTTGECGPGHHTYIPQFYHNSTLLEKVRNTSLNELIAVIYFTKRR